MSSLLDSIANRVLVCDGAMGSLLYERGAFVNRAFEELNLTRPALVEEVHRAYVEAGADVLETNTFGANRVRLEGFGLADKVADINRAGVNIARAVAAGGVYVAGAVGPLGLLLDASDETSHAEATRHFREQAEALSEAGVDLFMLETFRSVDELVTAVTAVVSVTDRPVVAQLTTNHRGDDPTVCHPSCLPEDCWMPAPALSGSIVVQGPRLCWKRSSVSGRRQLRHSRPSPVLAPRGKWKGGR